MQEAREVKCPSGAVLKVQAAPFSDSKALYQAVLKEAKAIGINSTTDFASLYKDLFCAGFSSEAIEKCLWKCFDRCTYDSGKGAFRINQETFEPVEARGDYMTVCIEVAKENILPFGKSLYAEYQQAMSMTANTQA